MKGHHDERDVVVRSPEGIEEVADAQELGPFADNDLEQALDGSAKIPAEPSRRVYNLYSLKPVSEKGAIQFPVVELAPGEGRFYVQATEEDFAKVRTELLIQQAKEALRVMVPDALIAARWKLDMTGVQKLRADAEAKMAAGDGDAALSVALEATKSLNDVMAGDKTLSECRKHLDAIRKKMGEMNVHMPWREEPWHEEPWKKNAALVKLVEPYWAAREKFEEFESHFIAGEDGEVYGFKAPGGATFEQETLASAGDTQKLLADILAYEEHVNKLAQEVQAAVGKDL